ncbi:hypothetical protein IHQ71_07965 [Rhizobium sp. TH2]|uniref:hypothetical protein n=1 Tax=Rhizobium sp. TH2 TaxID=2775403 RepID=UPI0021589B51|nr:hypothetical protein [Rhizobium sp. TH2]UVC12147.1 hypothetical protein IHQ71_07965 [Rhizobium sp. TH2]
MPRSDIIEAIASKEADVEGFKTVLLGIDSHEGAVEAICLKVDGFEAVLARHGMIGIDAAPSRAKLADDLIGLWRMRNSLK